MNYTFKVSRNIPKPIQRQVRQECAFGCILCGMPFFDYHHIIEFSEGGSHTVENIALLCPEHHTKWTRYKLTSLTTIQDARKNPFNANNEKTSSYVVDIAKKLSVTAGSNTIIGLLTPENPKITVIQIEKQAFFSVHLIDGKITISLKLTDETGKILLLINKGQLKVTTDIYDYTYEGAMLIIRRKLGGTILEMKLSDENIDIIKGFFINENGYGFQVKKERGTENSFVSVVKNYNAGGIIENNRLGSYETLLYIGKREHVKSAAILFET